MRLIVSCSKRISKGGTTVVVDCLPLAGFGKDEAEAISDVQRVVEAWCRALAQQGLLESALERAGLAAEGDDHEGIEIVVQVVE